MFVLPRVYPKNYKLFYLIDYIHDVLCITVGVRQDCETSKTEHNGPSNPITFPWEQVVVLGGDLICWVICAIILIKKRLEYHVS